MPEFKLQRFRGGYAICVYGVEGRISRRKLEHTDAAGAAKEFAKFVEEAKRPIDPDIATVWEKYRDDKEGRPIAKNMKDSGTKVLPFFGLVKPADVTLKMCRSYVALRRTDHRGSKNMQARFVASGRSLPIGVANGTIRTELNHLRVALRWAEKTGLIDRAPYIELPKPSQSDERHISKQEFTKLLDAAEQAHLRLYLLLAISTAGRNAALLELTWDRVDFERGLIFLGARRVLRPQKGRATVPMTDALRNALAAAFLQKRNDRVIEWAGEGVASVKTSLNKAVRRAKLVKVTPHMLRHSAAVWMAEAGVRMEEIAAFLGHSDVATTIRIYAKFSPTYLRIAAAPLEIPSRPRED